MSLTPVGDNDEWYIIWYSKLVSKSIRSGLQSLELSYVMKWVRI